MNRIVLIGNGFDLAHGRGKEDGKSIRQSI